MVKRTRLDRIEIDGEGRIGIRFAKELMEDGQIVASGFHRASLAPGDDASALCQVVSDDLSEHHGFPAITDEDIAKVQAAATAFHTTEVVANYRQALASGATPDQPAEEEPTAQ